MPDTAEELRREVRKLRDAIYDLRLENEDLKRRLKVIESVALPAEWRD